MSLEQIPTSKSPRIKVGLTIGDPSGIGPAITIKAVKKLKNFADFTIIGDAWVLKRFCHKDNSLNFARFIDLGNVSKAKFAFGRKSAEYGRASIEYLNKALEMIKNKEIDCLVTCPISKESINLAGFNYSGHTEYLAEQAKVSKIVMMLLNKDLRISLVTRHIPLKEVYKNLKMHKVFDTVFLTNTALKLLFGIKKPRIAVCGLNPHASDNGLIGDEENKIIKPALEKLKSKHKVNVYGPASADVVIYKAKKKEFDAVIAMYHDQALIPLKLSGDFNGVNLTLGLPFIRTSPLHGTAFDIANNFNKANPHSLIEAIRVAVECTSNQKKV